MNLSSIICPVCREPLSLEQRTVRCANSHSFDLAKEGYVNLLLSHQRRSNNPGDDKAMIQARRRFFDSGAFDPVAEKISHLLSGIPHPVILDCGCGEGHFLGALSGSAGGIAPPSDSEPAGRASLSERAEKFFGVDVSKEAIRCAAKRYKDVTCIVANGMRALPVADHSMDVILSVLAPRNIEEFARILKPDGKLILGVPGPNHLIELRTLLSTAAGDFEEKADEAAAKCAPLFTETDRASVSYEITLNSEQIADLIQMTPIFWNSAPEAKTEVRDLDNLGLTVSFALLTLGP
jgi:23S rRNA (guanine745-N1)-methyltransferase